MIELDRVGQPGRRRQIEAHNPAGKPCGVGQNGRRGRAQAWASRDCRLGVSFRPRQESIAGNGIGVQGEDFDKADLRAVSRIGSQGVGGNKNGGRRAIERARATEGL